MDISLEAFLAVARTGNLTNASRELGRTQSSVTKRIANLEANMSVALFQRHRRGMTLTPAGEVLLTRAIKIEAEYRQVREEIAAISGAGLSILRLGAGPLFHLNCVAGLFSTLKTQFPNIKLELSTDSNRPIAQMLRDGEMDVYLGVVPPEQLDDTIFIRYVVTVEHGIVMCADDPHAACARIDPTRLSQYSWVIFAIDPETENSIRKYCVPKSSISPTIDIRTTSFATGLQLVKQGGFVMSAPLQLAKRIESEGLVVRPTLQGMPVRQAGIHLRKSALSFGAIKTVLEFFGETGFEF